MLLGSKEIDGSERDFKIFLEIMVAFVRSKCMKLIRHSNMKGRSLVLSSAVDLSLIFDAYTFREITFS